MQKHTCVLDQFRDDLICFHPLPLRKPKGRESVWVLKALLVARILVAPSGNIAAHILLLVEPGYFGAITRQLSKDTHLTAAVWPSNMYMLEIP